MDYVRIYADFIKDRRAREATLTGYTERHHILPRCMGGGDDPGNLISLTPEDHYFAHLLLAKAHGGRNWASLHAMCHVANKHTKAHRARLAARMRFGHVRRQLAEYYRATLSGPDGKIADRMERTLRHIDGREVTGNRFYLEAETGVKRQQISAVLRGAKSSAHGWYCPSINPTGLVGKERAAATCRSREKITLWHHDGRVWSGSQSDFCDMTGLLLVWQSERHKSIAGWHRSEEDAASFAARKVEKAKAVSAARGSIDGASNPNADPTIYAWRVTETGEVIHATKFEIRSRFSMKPGQLSSLFNGRQAQTGGVALAEETDEIRAKREARRKSRRKEHSVGRGVSAHPGGALRRTAA